jgi:hypothetical protein
MAERINPLLVFGLLAAVGVYLLSRTKEGQSITEAAIAAGVEAISGPRGIRNNNPGNIVRSGVSWVGMSPDQSGDSRFIVFSAPEYGIRAMARVLKNYIAGGYTTVQQIINRWAPPIENDTSAYVNAVASSMGVYPTAQIDASFLEPLIAAIIQHENGQQPYDPSLIAYGIQLEATA